MILMRMHPAIADETQEVNPLALRLLKSLLQHRHLRQFAIADAFVDARQVLIHHAARPEIQMAHLAVAHLAFWQTHILTARADRRVWIGGVQMIMKRRARQQGRIAIDFGFFFAAGIDAPAVADDENNRFFGHERAASSLRLGKHQTRIATAPAPPHLKSKGSAPVQIG